MLAKVLTARLGGVIDSLISKNQSAFIKGRMLTDGVVVMNEVVDLARRSKKQCLILKVNFEKAYDSVNWGFLDYMMRRFGFDHTWRRWMRACVFTGNLSVLVNGCPTDEIQIRRGLKQGDPLAPFLFLLVAEGLGGLVREASQVGRFTGFQIRNSDLVITHLQYADDTLLVGEPTVENLWAMKAILRFFELASGLKVNFSKSSVLGVNVNPSFLTMAEGFLHCKIGVVPFRYLGLPVGASPTKLATWDPLVMELRRRVKSWRNRFISFGGRIVLLNSILNSIPTFFLSYYKMSIGVWKKLVRIQRDFLWGGCSSRRKIPWVRWSEVCKPKSGGGLGVKDLRAFNCALLGKWRWRLLVEDHSLWSDLLVAKYGEEAVLSPRPSVIDSSSLVSSWWRDICLLGSSLVAVGDWFGDRVVRRLGNGALISFWNDTWVGLRPLASVFPRLFLVSGLRDGRLCDFGRWEDGIWIWRLPWRRSLFVWEETIERELLALILPVVPNLEVDHWSWLGDASGIYSVRSAYAALVENASVAADLTDDQVLVMGRLWRSLAPPKVIAFSWQLLLDRLPTRDNLLRRRVIQDPGLASCPLCGALVESSPHLFLHCPFAMGVWYGVFRWLGWQLPMPPDLFGLFTAFCAFGSGSRGSGV